MHTLGDFEVGYESRVFRILDVEDRCAVRRGGVGNIGIAGFHHHLAAPKDINSSPPFYFLSHPRLAPPTLPHLLSFPSFLLFEMFITQRGLANAKNLLVQLISLSVLLALGGLKHDAFVASYQSWWVGLHVFSRGDSLETLEGFLAFAGENKINIKFAGVWMRSA